MYNCDQKHRETTIARFSQPPGREPHPFQLQTDHVAAAYSRLWGQPLAGTCKGQNAEERAKGQKSLGENHATKPKGGPLLVLLTNSRGSCSPRAMGRVAPACRVRAGCISTGQYADGRISRVSKWQSKTKKAKQAGQRWGFEEKEVKTGRKYKILSVDRKGEMAMAVLAVAS